MSPLPTHRTAAVRVPAVLFALGVARSLLGQAPAADWIVVADHILTMNDAAPHAESFAVRAGRFVSVGSKRAVQRWRGADTQVLEASGATVVPGFIDAHCHPRPIYPFESPHTVVDVGPDKVKTISELVALLRRKAEMTPQGRWVRARGYQDTRFGRLLTRHDLDAVSRDHFVFVGHSSGHLGVFNSRALERAKIGVGFPDPPGGKFAREEDGSPSGVCMESAMNAVFIKCPRRSRPTVAERIEGLRRCFVDFLRHGVTTVGDAGLLSVTLQLYQDTLRPTSSAAEDFPRLRVAVMPGSNVFRHLHEAGVRCGFGDEWLWISAVKFFHGNSLSGRTCWLSKPYEGRPDYFGIQPSRTADELRELVSEIHGAGYQIAVHCNGDREIEMVLDAFEAVLKESPRRDHRHRIEHGSVMRPDLLQRVRKLELVLAPHSYVFEHGDKMEAYGAQRWDWMHANRSAIELGIPVAGNSDWPVSANHPMLRIQSLVTRRCFNGKVYGAKQRISVEQALRSWTKWAAFSLRAEDRIGSIEVGKLADFVVLDQDPRSVEPSALGRIAVRATFCGGRKEWEAKGR